MTIELVDTIHFEQAGPYVVQAALGHKFQRGDVAACYIRAQGIVGASGWTAVQTKPLGALFWKVLSGEETWPRFTVTGPFPVDLEKCWGMVCRGLSPTTPITASWGVAVREQ